MISYIAPKNIDDRIVHRTIQLLSDGGLIAIPTDTSWTIACALSSKKGIKTLRRLSGERDERHFTLLCNSISQIGDYCSLSNSQFRLIKRLTPGPYVFVLKTLLGTEKALDIRRKEIGIRIPAHPVPARVIQELGEPMYSITAKRSMQGIASEGIWQRGDKQLPVAVTEQETGSPALPPIPEEDLFEGGWELEDIPGLDLILDTGEELPRLYSTVLDFTSDDIVLLRSGAGLWPI
ncbi:L-threonylcarbamoyladenylate synthase [Gracilinema caldarium]|uniref:SUA5/yciO/yrdC domain protein n=1 Tax=Gracilinema caldarium (strain ATCC 51460 / DSM 7334 / H1) TaxID=744872 RepID=F8F0Y1_GRAC1|nr:L-threonylcarbamoyladenylate synthase [Gracilinema caldarium]AEJ20267.1 SUA5/yciO/yrdC domain protein [Gracilinema caldarium DSM 7334]